jgi:hypothetical protein
MYKIQAESILVVLTYPKDLLAHTVPKTVPYGDNKYSHRLSYIFLYT